MTARPARPAARIVRGCAVAACIAASLALPSSALAATKTLSTLTPTSATNGWGPVEKDRSNGEQAAGDGRTITLAGVTHATGFGVHAGSDIRFDVGALGCTGFSSSVGVDDEVGSNGSVAFQVYADGVLKSSTGTLTGTSATVDLSAAISGAKELRLVVTDGGNGVGYDHADWASARLDCPDATVVELSSMTPTSSTNGWGPAEKNMSNGEKLAGDGRTLTIAGATYATGLGTNSHANIAYGLGGMGCTRFTATVGIDDEVGSLGTARFQVITDGVSRYVSPTMYGSWGAGAVDVDITGATELRLVTQDAGDGAAYDHGDWALARVTCAAAAPAPAPAPAPVATETRNMYKWPFSRHSIWNMPIGSGAVYSHAGLQRTYDGSGRVVKDPEHISVDPSFPLKPLNSDEGAIKNEYVHTDPNMAHNGSWNGCATFLRQDKRTVHQGQPLRLSLGGNPSWKWTIGFGIDLKGHGHKGCHGGSRLSGIGGTIRKGEMEAPGPFRHAFKINVYAKRFLSNDHSGYKWPATVADAYYKTGYTGPNPKMVMGTLLALPPDADLSWITNARVKKIAIGLRDYGGYIVDDTAWDVHAFSVEKGAAFEDGSSTFHSELQTVMTKLATVDNSSATSTGGGGTPRAPLAPCFSDGDCS